MEILDRILFEAKAELQDLLAKQDDKIPHILVDEEPLFKVLCDSEMFHKINKELAEAKVGAAYFYFIDDPSSYTNDGKFTYNIEKVRYQGLLFKFEICNTCQGYELIRL